MMSSVIKETELPEWQVKIITTKTDDDPARPFVTSVDDEGNYASAVATFATRKAALQEHQDLLRAYNRRREAK